MPITTGQEYLSLLEKSQLLDTEVLTTLAPQVEKHSQTDPKRLAMTLIKNQLITEYQARQLMSGKYKGFYLARYKLMELLGMGGMGRVYLAEQVSMERLVAIKLISLTRNKDRQKQALARFAREARAVAALRHPNIIQAFDFVNENGMPYIVMEYVEGMDTARLVHKFGPIPWKQAAEYARQTALGLAHAHAAGIVHRDIKPGNLLVDSSGQVKILDLGLVSAFDEKNDDSLTVDQDQLGTVDFIAPEQAVDSKSVDARADIYSLGATLYSIMSGRVLFPDKSTAQKLLLHQTTDPEAIDQLVKDCPAGLAAIIHQMLAKKPADRIQSATELAASLAPFCEPRTPPYELGAIKYRRSVYEGFLGKSPEPDKITVPTLGSPDADKVDLSASRSATASSPGTIRTSSMITASSDPAIDEFAQPEDDYTQLAMELPAIIRRKKSKKEKKKKPETSQALQVVAVVGSLCGLMLAAWLGNHAIRGMAAADEPRSRVTVTSPSPRPAPPPSRPASSPPISNNPSDVKKYVPFEFRPYCNTLTTVPMFNKSAGPAGETMISSDWKSRKVENVPFQLINPEGIKVPNALLLHGTVGDFAPKLPRKIEIPIKQKTSAIHLLSGMGGYCHPSTRERNVVMRVTIKYQGGSTEQVKLLNGVHFADYIRRIDVPESKFAFQIGDSQVRYLRVPADKGKTVNSIVLEKETDSACSPIVLAITLQKP